MSIPSSDRRETLVPPSIHPVDAPAPASSGFASPEPTVTLLTEESTAHPVAVTIAAAWSCYGGRAAKAENVRKLLNDPPKPDATPSAIANRENRRDRALALYASLFAAGHHTTFQHSTFVFVLDNVSRLAIWSFFHSHPYYNSEQVSQRYREVTGDTMVTPELPDEEAAIYRGAIERSLEGYRRLVEILTPAMAANYGKVFPGRAKAAQRDDSARVALEGAVQKKAQEIARYVLPLATPAHLYHTVNGLTLLRYHALANQPDAPAEVRLIVRKMVDAVLEVDPLFLGAPEYPLDIRPLLAEETEEARAIAHWRASADQDLDRVERFCREFDGDLEAAGVESRLVGAHPDTERIFADAIRTVVGATRDEVSDEDAIAQVLDAVHNTYLGHPLYLGMHSKLMQTMAQVPFTFAKRISGAEAAQSQRHRSTVASAPLLTAHLRRDPDVITPHQLLEHPEALAEYNATVQALWDAKNALLDRGVAPEVVLYLLPNSHRIREYETGTLQSYYWKWVKRLCFDAQREIFDTARDEVKQVRELFPVIGRYVDGPPCVQRSRAGATPICPEGERFCGIPVWRNYSFETLADKRVM
ncbi:MAG TPA: FAD-dependent thymidylate synthase [Thermomicrobiales bacterium]|jgi:thymidylate synthase ThyX|nr:FAD-dependent thymidylate synthase [Thermomicrobiales bacterium]